MPVKMVCFTEGPFAQEARALGIDTQVLPGRNFFRNLNTLTHMVQAEGFDIIHSHGARGNMMAAFLAKRTGLPTVSTVHSDYRLDYLGRPPVPDHLWHYQYHCPAKAGLPHRGI